PCPCDLGVAIGTPGIGRDDIFTTTFVLDATADLVLDDFAGELIGIRVTSVRDGFGDPKDEFKDGPRGGSAKLVVTIPEPSTALLIALGLGALGYAGRRS
ncbi:MAG: PEP-CTERM sorting domain-containing protein, partial [Myxococcota bacterium]